MIGAYLEENLHNPQRGDCFVMGEVNTSVYRLQGLKPEEQAEADRVIQVASFILGRSVPPHCYPPLYRKYHKVNNSDTTYAFGILESNRKEVRGTQGWSVQMALQLKKKVYVYDKITLQWYKGDTFLASLPFNDEQATEMNRFKPCDLPRLDQKSNISLPVAIGINTRKELQKLLARRS